MQSETILITSQPFPGPALELAISKVADTNKVDEILVLSYLVEQKAKESWAVHLDFILHPTDRDFDFCVGGEVAYLDPDLYPEA